jgi:hypothetical protein
MKTVREKFHLLTSAFSLRPLALILAFSLQPLALFPQSTNKTFMLNNGQGGTINNALPPSVSNFFLVNSNLLNQSVKPSSGGGGGGGGSSPTFTPQFDYNAGNGTSIVAGVSITNAQLYNPDSVGNLFVGSNAYVGKTNFANNVTVSNRLTFLSDGMQEGDSSGSLAFFNPTSTEFNFGGSVFGASDGVINAGTVNAAFNGNGAGLTNLNFSQFTNTVTVNALTDPTNLVTIDFPNTSYWILAGDSLTSGFGGVNNYFYYLTNLYGFSSVGWENSAIAAQAAGTIDTNYVTEIHDYLPGPGTNCVLAIWAGINDLGLSGNFSAEQIFGFLTNIWHKAHQDGMTVVAFTVSCSLNAPTSPVTFNSAEFQRYRLNSMIRNSPQLWDYLVDVAAFTPTPEEDRTWYIDNVHFTSASQQFIAYNMANVLSRSRHLQTTKYEGPYNTVGNPIYVDSPSTAVADRGLTVLEELYGTFAGIACDSGGAFFGLSVYFPSVNFYGATSSSDTGGLFESFASVSGNDAVTFPTTSVYVRDAVIATNGFASCNTNVLTSAAATSWSGQLSTINNGFTNTYGTNCTININGSVGYFIFWHSGGVGASTAAANPQFTNALSTNGWSRSLPINCGVQVVPLTGQANVTVDFGQ